MAQYQQFVTKVGIYSNCTIRIDVVFQSAIWYKKTHMVDSALHFPKANRGSLQNLIHQQTFQSLWNIIYLPFSPIYHSFGQKNPYIVVVAKFRFKAN